MVIPSLRYANSLLVKNTVPVRSDEEKSRLADLRTTLRDFSGKMLALHLAGELLSTYKSCIDDPRVNSP